jgi:hypothetical protein
MTVKGFATGLSTFNLDLMRLLSFNPELRTVNPELLINEGEHKMKIRRFPPWLDWTLIFSFNQGWCENVRRWEGTVA